MCSVNVSVMCWACAWSKDLTIGREVELVSRVHSARAVARRRTARNSAFD